MLREPFLIALWLIERNAPHDEIASVLLCHLLNQRHFEETWPARGGPEVEQKHLPALLAYFDFLAVEIS